PRWNGDKRHPPRLLLAQESGNGCPTTARPGAFRPRGGKLVGRIALPKTPNPLTDSEAGVPGRRRPCATAGRPAPATDAMTLPRPTARPRLLLAGLAAPLAVVLWAYWPTLAETQRTWATNPQYSHGYLVPLFALLLLWLRRDRLAPEV